MNQALKHSDSSIGCEPAERKRVEAVVETLANLRSPGETLAAVAHDARNMVTALGLYCDLLEEPGVLAAPFAHYGGELRLVAAASRRLVEKLVSMDAPAALPSAPENRSQGRAFPGTGVGTAAGAAAATVAARRGRADRGDTLPSLPIANLAAELLANRNLLAALAGPAIGLTVEAEGGACPVRLTAEDLTRILVNLVKNAAEAMSSGGRIHIALGARAAAAGAKGWLSLSVEDSGPGIAANALEKVFEPGYTTRRRDTNPAKADVWPVAHRGLGLAITRSIVEQAGGRVFAASGAAQGARIEIELPVRKGSF
ncbi:MAG: ATP-binding protein [Terracidiphilus sp.]